MEANSKSTRRLRILPNGRFSNLKHRSLKKKHVEFADDANVFFLVRYDLKSRCKCKLIKRAEQAVSLCSVRGVS